jgi:fumarylacetoacetase
MSKNFHTTISPWLVTSEALEPFRISQPRRPEGDPQPLPYLWSESDQARGAYALTLQAWLQSAKMRERGQEPIRLSAGPASHMYWTVAQMIAHHTANGCNLQPGDLLGTGTISGPDRTSCGSLMEITRGGAEPLQLSTGEMRRFLEDGDEVSFTATATAPGTRAIGFGDCRATVSAAQ